MYLLKKPVLLKCSIIFPPGEIKLYIHTNMFLLLSEIALLFYYIILGTLIEIDSTDQKGMYVLYVF